MKVVQCRESNRKGKLSRWRIEVLRKKDRERKRKEKRRKKERPLGVVARLTQRCNELVKDDERSRKLYMLCGIAPIQKQSGNKEWIRKIWGGRSDIRAALYMGATACLLWNSRMKAYYDKKRKEGRPHNWAMVPVMRKVLSILNRIARDESYHPLPESEEFTQKMVGKLKQGWADRKSK